MRSLLLLAVCVTFAIANPLWYHKVPNTELNTYIGYGSGVNESKAKQEAFNDITSQISVNIDSSFTQNQVVKNGKLKSSESFSTAQNSKAILNDYKLLKSEFSSGKYYVAIEYENIPSLDKFIKKVQKTAIDELEEQNTYLKHTLIAKKLKKAIKMDVDFGLVRKDLKWFIKYKNILQPLDKKDFGRFFTSVQNPKIELNTNKNRNILYDNDKFFFKVKSAQKGFVSILSVYEDGTVATLVRNIPISKNKTENIPDEDFETIPQAGLISNGLETYDLYVAVFSTQKIKFDSFAYADEELISEEKYKNFDTLIEFLDDKTYGTLKVVTKPRY